MSKYFKTKKKIRCKDTGEICIGYASYLKSKHWGLIRARIIQNHPYCEMCKSAEKPLQVHHLSYKRLGAEKDSDLTPLCDDCHVSVHQMSKEDVAKIFGLRVKKPKTGFKKQPKKPKAKPRKAKPKRKICKGCMCYKRNEETKKYYCSRTGMTITGNSSACKRFSCGSEQSE